VVGEEATTVKKDEVDVDVDVVREAPRDGGVLPFFAGMAIVFLAFFAYLLLTPDIPVGQGLVFDDMAVERLDNETLSVSGSILNTMDGKRKIPVIRTTYIGQEDIDGDSHLFYADKNILDAGESIPISFILNDVPPDVLDIRISFELQADG